MPWKQKSPMDLRREFIKRLAANERLTDLCREYGISRKTGSKFKKRFEELGVPGLADQSRAPRVIPHKTPPEVEAVIIAERQNHPSWGPKKLKDILERRLETSFPSAAAIGSVLARNGLVRPRTRRQRHQPTPTTLRQATSPNEVWCIDYKGQFRLGDGTYCYPLTITDSSAATFSAAREWRQSRTRRRVKSARRSSVRMVSRPSCVPTMAFPSHRRVSEV